MFRKSILISMAVLVLCLLLPMQALAHGTTEVGDYELEIGFHNEPALQGESNGVDVFVTDTKTKEKVNGLEDTLKVEAIYGSSKKTFNLEPQEDLDGAYIAYFVPTQTGDYTFHITGQIKDTPVDVSMTSAPDTFNSVESVASYSFPAADSTSTSSGPASQWVFIAGIAGLIFGLAGLIVGLIALSTARHKTE